ARIDAFLGDHFGLREVLIRAHKDLTKPLLGFGNSSVLVGRDGRLFYLGQEAVQQSAGLLVRDHRVSDTADLLARMNAALKARGVGFLVAVPPNAASIYADDLPNWAQNPARRADPTVDSRSRQRLRRHIGQARPDHHGVRRFVHPRLFRPNADAARR